MIEYLTKRIERLFVVALTEMVTWSVPIARTTWTCSS